MEEDQVSTYLKTQPDEKGFFGEYGGSFIPPELQAEMDKITDAYYSISKSHDFISELRSIRKHFQGRPTPTYFCRNMSRNINGRIYLKREDLNHTGAHKINNAIGQILIAKRLGKSRIIAETGAGQHGVATATVCALMGMKCVIYMGKLDVDRQAPNVLRMKMLGADVIPVYSGIVCENTGYSTQGNEGTEN